jgi:hypothetical protein
MVLNGQRLESPPEYFVQHLLVYLPLLTQPFGGILRFLNGIGRRATINTLCVEGICRIFEDILPIVIYTGHSFLSQGKLERCVPSDMKIRGTSASPTQSSA